MMLPSLRDRIRVDSTSGRPVNACKVLETCWDSDKGCGHLQSAPISYRICRERPPVGVRVEDVPYPIVSLRWLDREMWAGRESCRGLRMDDLNWSTEERRWLQSIMKLNLQGAPFQLRIRKQRADQPSTDFHFVFHCVDSKMLLVCATRQYTGTCMVRAQFVILTTYLASLPHSVTTFHVLDPSSSPTQLASLLHWHFQLVRMFIVVGRDMAMRSSNSCRDIQISPN